MPTLITILRRFRKPRFTEKPVDPRLPTITDASEEYRPQIEAAEREAEELLEPAPRQIGWDHQFAVAKKEILRDKYGLNWKGPMYDGRDK